MYTFDHQQANRRVQQLGLSYAALGIHTARGAVTVSDWLRGKSDPPSSWVCALALILGLDHPGELYRPLTDDDVAVEVATVPQVRTLSRRRRLARLNQMAP
jgi:hypothetical protein